MFDVVIRNGNLISSSGAALGCLGIRNGVIETVAEAGATLTGQIEIDAAGKHVLPGLVDAHVHLREPGLVAKEGFASGTRAAAAGGVTTVMVMPTDNPWTATPEQFEEKRALAEGQCYVDYALQAAVGPRGADLRRLAELGAISFELFIAGGTPDFLVKEDTDLLDLLRQIRAVGGVAGITAGSPGLIAALTAAQKQAGPGTARDFLAARPVVSENLGVVRAAVAAMETDARIHFRQISAGSTALLLRKLGEKQLITAEVTPHNLLLTDDDAERLGPFGAVIPPLRPEAEGLALQRALREGVIDIVATDHAPHLPGEKERGREDIWLAPSGLPGLQTLCLAMLELVGKQAITWQDLVRTCAEQPARLFGLYPRKGRLAPGSDADVLIIDPDATTEIRNEDQFSKAGITPFAGRTVKGAISEVLLRGRTIVRGGEIVGEPAGRFVKPSKH